MNHLTRTTTTRAADIQNAGDVKIRVAKPPDCADVDPPRMPPPPEPPPPRKPPKSPPPLPTNEVNKLIITTVSHFYLRNTSNRSTAPPAHAAGEFMRSAITVDVPPPET